MSAEKMAAALDLIQRLGEGDREAETTLFKRAGSGDSFSQRALAACLMQYPDNPGMLVAAEVVARMCASGGNPSHRLFLAGALALCADGRAPEDVADLQAECLTILTDLADNGDEDAANLIQLYADGFTPEALAAARKLATKPALAAPEPVPVVRVATPLDQLFADIPDDTPRSLRLKWWAADRLWSIRFYFTDLKLALGSLGRAIIGRGL